MPGGRGQTGPVADRRVGRIQRQARAVAGSRREPYDTRRGAADRGQHRQAAGAAKPRAPPNSSESRWRFCPPIPAPPGRLGAASPFVTELLHGRPLLFSEGVRMLSVEGASS
jgi:hypothetical protein